MVRLNRSCRASSELEEGGYDETAAFGRCRLQAPLEAVVQTPVAGQEPDVEQRKQQLRVIRLDAGEVSELANVLAHRQPKVPQRLQQRRDGELFAGADRPFGHDQQIDIRVKAKRPSAVPAERADRDGHRGLRTGGFGYLAHQAVHAIGVTRENIQTAASLAGARGILVPSLGQATSQHGERLRKPTASALIRRRTIGGAYRYHRHAGGSNLRLALSGHRSGLVITDAMPRVSRCDAPTATGKSGRISRQYVMLKPNVPTALKPSS